MSVTNLQELAETAWRSVNKTITVGQATVKVRGFSRLQLTSEFEEVEVGHLYEFGLSLVDAPRCESWSQFLRYDGGCASRMRPPVVAKRGPGLFFPPALHFPDCFDILAIGRIISGASSLVGLRKSLPCTG